MNRSILTGAALLALILVAACGKQAAPPEEKFGEGRRLLESGEYAAAQQFFETEIAAAPGDPEPVFLAGQAAAMGANYAAAEAHFNKALELKPETAAYHGWLGRLYGAQARVGDIATRLRLAPKVRDNFLKAVELDPKDAESKFFLGVFYIVAPPNVGGNPNAGKAFADELMGSHPLLAQRLLGQFHRARRQSAEAEAALQAAAQLAPDDPQSHTDLGDFYIADKQFDRAMESFTKAVELDPRYQPGLFGIGQVGVLAPEHADRGIEALEALLALPANITSPNRGQAAYGLGAIYALQGRTDEAIAAYQRAVELGYGFASKPLEELKTAASAAETTDTQETVAPESPGDPAPEETGDSAPAEAPVDSSAVDSPATETSI